MKEVLFAILIVSIMFISVLIAFYLFLKNSKNENNSSKEIIDYFIPDNSSYELSEMINFYKEMKLDFKYFIKE